jgi:hypothetical protein
MSITEHPLFPQLKSHLIAQPAGNPNFRIEVSNSMPPKLVAKALSIKIPCARCGRKMHPFRARKSPGSLRGGNAKHIYFNACCPLQAPYAMQERWEEIIADLGASIGALRKALKEAASYPRFCNRGGAASEEYERVVKALQ